MRASSRFVLGSVLVAGTLTVLACTTDYQKGLEDPNYGAPNALAGQQAPGPSQQVAAAQSSSSGGASASAPLCASKGGTLVDGGTCSVSFAKDVLPALGAGNCQTVGCHGGATPQTPPKIDPGDAPGTYQAFAQFAASNGKPYIDPCSIDPNDSVIAFNVDVNAPAASKGTLMPPGGAGLPTAVGTITTWVKCGAPNN